MVYLLQEISSEEKADKIQGTELLYENRMRKMCLIGKREKTKKEQALACTCF